MHFVSGGVLRAPSCIWACFSMTAMRMVVCASGPGGEMARSDFNWGAEDWELFGPGKLKVYERGGMLYGSVSPSNCRIEPRSLLCAALSLRYQRVVLWRRRHGGAASSHFYVSRTGEQDNGRTVWYFSAPDKFLGQKAFAHTGNLSFRLGFFAMCGGGVRYGGGGRRGGLLCTL